MSQEAICQLNQLIVGYKTEAVLSGVDLTLERGTITGLLGGNGAGKTTLMRAALGLIEARSGSAKLLGEYSDSTANKTSPSGNTYCVFILVGAPQARHRHRHLWNIPISRFFGRLRKVRAAQPVAIPHELARP